MFIIKKKKKGLTLLETLISFLILTFVLTPMLMIINSSVKTNKSGEDKQKTLYIAQKYAEDFKRKDIERNKLGKIQKFKNKDVPDDEIDPDIPDGYFVNVIVEDLPRYKFSVTTNTAISTTSALTGTDENTDSTTSSGYNSIQYDAKVKIIKSDKAGIVAYLDVDGKDNTKRTCDLNNEYRLEISNDKDKDIISSEEKKFLLIILKDSTGKVINEEPWKIYKDPNTNKNANIVIQVDSNEQTSSNVDLYIDCYNKINESNMSVYFAKSKKTTLPSDFNNDVVNCHLENKQGQVSIYSNIYNNTTNNYSDSDTRVYKITVMVFKDGQDSPINQVITYKTVQQ